MGELRRAERVYWLNVKENAPIPEEPEKLNEALEEATDRWGNLEILDMNARLAEPKFLLEFNIHLSEAGQREFVELVVESLPDVV